jgi:tetratricopeptide (TPR) repeat protein
MDWFRRKSWSKTDEEEFFLRLGRARKTSRAQYLKIQAIELLETKEAELLDVAEGLLKIVLTDYLDDWFERSSTLHTLGDIQKQRGHFEQALHCYEQALETEREHPQVKTQAYLDYAELVVKQKNHSRYDAVEALIRGRADTLLFPIEKYKAYSILSIISAFKGNRELAVRFAELADQSAGEETSGLRYHQSLGVVGKRDEGLDRLVKKNS